MATQWAQILDSAYSSGYNGGHQRDEVENKLKAAADSYSRWRYGDRARLSETFDEWRRQKEEYLVEMQEYLERVGDDAFTETRSRNSFEPSEHDWNG